MLCSNCGKREVEVLIKQVVNNEVHNLSLCRPCAEELGFVSPDIPSITISFSLSEGENANQRKTVKNGAARAVESSEIYESLICESCGLEYSAFEKSGLLGCAGCYKAFRFPLGAHLQQFHGAESHWSGSEAFRDISVLDVAGGDREHENYEGERTETINRLKSEIEEAVQKEEYERAAELRDLLTPLLGTGEEKDDY